MLDYLVCSNHLVHYIKDFKVQPQVPWAPHDGIELELMTRPRDIMVANPRRARPLLLPNPATPVDPQVAAQRWQQAKLASSRAPRYTQGGEQLGQAMGKYARRIDITKDSTALADKWLRWAGTLEEYFLNENGKTDDRSRGRARAPQVQHKPLLDRPRLSPEALGINGGMGVVGQLWHTLKALTGRLAKALANRQQHSN